MKQPKTTASFTFMARREIFEAAVMHLIAATCKGSKFENEESVLDTAERAIRDHRELSAAVIGSALMLMAAMNDPARG